MENKARAEIESIEATRFHGFGGGITRAGGNRHRKTQSEGRNALDFGDRDDREYEQWRPRALSPFQETIAEDSDRIVYTRREQSKQRAMHLQSLR